MKLKLLLTATALLLCFQAEAETKIVSSPNGKLVVTIENAGGQTNYSIQYNSKQILEPSALGLFTDLGDLTNNLQLTSSEPSSIDETYDMTRTKASKITYKANRLDLNFENDKKLKMTITFQVADNSVAYRYSLPKENGVRCIKVTGEASSFKFPEQTTTFLCPQSVPMVGWKRTKPSYEEEYKLEAPMSDKSAQGAGYTLPCLFHIGDNGWALVSETGVTSQYVGSHLSDFNATRGYTIAFPQAGENNGIGDTSAAFALPGCTPWRTLSIGDNLKPIVETTVAFDVVKPLYKPSVNYKQGRSVWSWILWDDKSINYPDQKAFIDLSHDLGWEMTLIDNYWDNQIGRDKMEELIKYAHSQGVDVQLWYNSNGAWNDSEQSPYNCMNTSVARKNEMQWLRDNGVKGIKVDFFGGDKQETMRLYEDILSDANEYGIQCIFHGCTLPRGWERMYPNYVASEAVLASENMKFGQHFDDLEGQNACLHPFIRNAVASMDFGGTFFNKHISRDNKNGCIRRTSETFEMATAIAFQSSIQNFALAPNNLTEQPKFEIDFMKAVPTTWDETKFIAGYPGKYFVVARRTGDKWYVAAINGTSSVMKLKVNLPMLPACQATYYYDKPALKGEAYPPAQFGKIKIDKKGTADITLQPLGGAIITK